ncbi:arsenite methyltransferase [Candidatus Beckwithbacteria bacterium]|nr:arsenite methyltransferase [Candidatus Beckwithbacteria bacterium]
MIKKSQIKELVRSSYSQLAQGSGCGCKCSCSPVSNFALQRQTLKNAYSQTEMDSTPTGANLGLGCGNPTAIISLKKGQTVVDLGCGAGFDVFLAANKVSKTGKVIGVDFSQSMLSKAKTNAQKGGYTNTQFLKGDIEDLPIKDQAVDVVISNCVINLAPDKNKVFSETYRILKKGGRLMVSDVVLLKPLPQALKNDKELLTGCIAGAVLKEKYLELIKKAGFTKITVHSQTSSAITEYAVSISVSAQK